MSQPSKAEREAWKTTALGYVDEVAIHRFMHAELTHIDKTKSEVRFTTAKQHLTPLGTLHAGTMYITLELANVIASLPHAAIDENMSSIRHSVSLLGTVSGEGHEIQVSSRLVKRGRNIAFFEAEAVVEKTGLVLARSQTIKVISRIEKAKL